MDVEASVVRVRAAGGFREDGDLGGEQGLNLGGEGLEIEEGVAAGHAGEQLDASQSGGAYGAYGECTSEASVRARTCEQRGHTHVCTNEQGWRQRRDNNGISNRSVPAVVPAAPPSAL